jgi:hypothetical protein
MKASSKNKQKENMKKVILIVLLAVGSIAFLSQSALADGCCCNGTWNPTSSGC